MEDSVPQFDGAGPKVFVKNTFLDFEETPLAPPPLERVRTVPATCRYGSEPVELDEEPEDGARAKSAQVPETVEDEEEDATLTGDEAEEQQQQAGLKLLKTTTRDWYEPAQDWDWASQEASPSQPAPMAASPMAAPHIAVTGPAPVMYQGMPMAPGATTVMVPMLLPVGTPMAAGYSPNAALPVMGGHSPMAGTGPAMSSPSMGGQSPVSPNRPPSDGSSSQGIWPPPPPEMAPTIERVASGGMGPPMISPDAKKLGNLMAQMQAYDPNDGAGDGKDASQAASGSAPAAPIEPVKSPTAAGPQPQTLMRAFSISSGYYRVHWTVDARKLKGNDKQAVSPPFELSFGRENVIFKMMIYPKVMNDSKGGASFKKAKGRGYVQLKCEAEIAEGVAKIKFRIGVGEGANAQGPRGPQLHNFSQSAVCGLSKDQEEWNFEEVVDKDSQTFRVTLEIVPTGG